IARGRPLPPARARQIRPRPPAAARRAWRRQPPTAAGPVSSPEPRPTFRCRLEDPGIARGTACSAPGGQRSRAPYDGYPSTGCLRPTVVEGGCARTRTTSPGIRLRGTARRSRADRRRARCSSNRRSRGGGPPLPPPPPSEVTTPLPVRGAGEYAGPRDGAWDAPGPEYVLGV